MIEPELPAGPANAVSGQICVLFGYMAEVNHDYDRKTGIAELHWYGERNP